MSRTREGGSQGPEWAGRSPSGGGGSAAGVLLVGHGSHHSSDSARPVHLLARRLRENRAFAEVRVGFWKEDPHLHTALDLVESREVLVVPLFTSTGYFTETVVPRELGLVGRVTRRSGRVLRLCPPVGAHPHMEAIVRERAREVAPLDAGDEAGATLVVIGHGTDAHSRSGDTTLAVVERIRARGPYRRVLAAFLDQDPRVEQLLPQLADGNVILVPFFMSEGWHAGSTVPATLAISGGRTERGGTTIWYAQPVGTHPSLVDLVHRIVREEEGGEGRTDGPDDRTPGRETDEKGPGGRSPPTPSDVREAREAFAAWLGEAGPDGWDVLQAVVRPLAPQPGGAGATPAHERRYEIRHVDDRGRDGAELRQLLDPEDALEVAARSGNGVHRPLKTAPDLAGGWRLTDLSPDQVWEAYAHLYPTALVHRHLALRGRLALTPFARAAPRQTGIYAGVAELDEKGVERVVSRCCAPGRCLRRPTWAGGDPAGEKAGPGGQIPCPEPCSVFMSMARTELEAARGSRRTGTGKVGHGAPEGSGGP